jgi:hypothetical protein
VLFIFNKEFKNQLKNLFFFLTKLNRYQMVGSASRGSGPINHRIFSFHRKFSLDKMTGWRFEHPTFGTESLQIES